MTAPTIGTITWAWNQSPEHLEAAISSAIEADFDQIVLVDDGSDVPIENRWGSAVGLVRIDHSGISTAFSAGIPLLRCDYTCRLPSDDVFAPEKADRLRKYIRDTGARAVAHDWKENGTRVSPLHGNIRQDNTVYGGATALWTPIIRELGGYDPELIWCCDWDFHVRVAELVSWEYLPEVLTTRKILATGMSANAAQNAKAFHRERSFVHRKWSGR